MSNILLTKSIYSEVAIKHAIDDFKKLARIDCVLAEQYYQLTFHDCYYNMDLTMREFENHVIDLMVSKDGI